MKPKTVNHSEVAVAILGAGLALGLALKLLEILRPVAAVLGQ
jgi:hypothetical protein